jgi:hypothetical protein
VRLPRGRLRARRGPRPAEGVSDRESIVSSMVRWSKRSRSRGSHPVLRRAVRPCGDEASEPSSRSVLRSRQRSAAWADQLAVSGLGGVETPVQRRHTVLPCPARRSLSSAWVFVFDNVGCISRPDASRSFRARIARSAQSDLTRAEPRCLRRRHRGASRVNWRAKTVHLAWTTGRADRAGEAKASLVSRHD